MDGAMVCQVGDRLWLIRQICKVDIFKIRNGGDRTQPRPVELFRKQNVVLGCFGWWLGTPLPLPHHKPNSHSGTAVIPD